MLNLSSGGGSGNYIRFSPQANAWTNQDGEIQLGKVVFDIDNVTTGWLELGVGVATVAAAHVDRKSVV